MVLIVFLFGNPISEEAWTQLVRELRQRGKRSEF